MLLSFLLSVHSRHQLANKLWARRFFINKHFSFSQRNYLDTMLSCYLFLIISLMISFRDVRGASDPSCTDNPVFTPSALVVKYGDPANVTCFACQKDCREDNCGLEKAVGEVTKNGTTMFWTVDRLTEWDMPLICYYNHVASGQCSSSLDLTLYQPPESVSISFVNHTGMMFENQQYTLQCSVQNVAPVQSLTVTFYRGNTALGHLQSNHSEEKKPVNESFTLNITSSREDDGAQYWCETKLELGPAGPQRPPVVTSEKLPAIVHYGPELKEPPNPDVITITEGDTLHLNCSSVGNPSPSYTWTLPTNSPSYSGSVLTIKSVGFEHEGQYICTVSNTVGTVTKEFNIDVQASPLIWIIAGVSAAVLFVFIVSVLCFRYYKQNRKGSYNLKDVLRFPKRTALPLQNCENV